MGGSHACRSYDTAKMTQHVKCDYAVMPVYFRLKFYPSRNRDWEFSTMLQIFFWNNLLFLKMTQNKVEGRFLQLNCQGL